MNSVETVLLDGHNKMLRSAIFLDDEEFEMYFGEQAISHYIDGVEGRLMTSIKSVLGSSLMDEKTRVFNEMRPFSDILGYFLKHIKTRAEYMHAGEIDSVILGRPVRFNDKDDKLDELAEHTLRKIAAKQGFKHIEFQYEPIAAAMAYEKESTKEELALIIDIGGGTSDFTIIKIDPKNNTDSSSNILSTSGIHIGGTDFDTLLNYNTVMPVLGARTTVKATNGLNINVPTACYHDLSTWHKINKLYSKASIRNIKNALAQSNEMHLTNRLFVVLENRYGHNIMEKIEIGKKALSGSDNHYLDLGLIEKDLKVELTKGILEKLISADINQIKKVLEGLLKDACINVDDIDVVFFTGGTTQIGKIQRDIMNVFRNAKMVKGDVFGSVVYGLTLDAIKKFS